MNTQYFTNTLVRRGIRIASVPVNRGRAGMHCRMSTTTYIQEIHQP